MRAPARCANRRSSACRSAPRSRRDARAPHTACRSDTKKNSLARRGFAILLRISFRRGKIERRFVAAGREGEENENEANGAGHGDADRGFVQTSLARRRPRGKSTDWPMRGWGGLGAGGKKGGAM